MIQEGFLGFEQSTKVVNSPQHQAEINAVLLGSKQAALTQAAARLRDGAKRLNAQVSRQHEGYWNSLLDLRTRWRLLGQQTATKYNVGVDFGFNVISTLDTVLDICMDEEDDDITVAKNRQMGDVHLKVITSYGVHEDEEKSADSEKAGKLNIGKRKMKKAQKAQFAQNLYQQMLSEAVSEGALITEGAIRLDSNAEIRSITSAENNKITPPIRPPQSSSTFPEVILVLAQQLQLLQYKANNSANLNKNNHILATITSFYRHMESRLRISALLDNLAVKNPGFWTHWLWRRDSKCDSLAHVTFASSCVLKFPRKVKLEIKLDGTDIKYCSKEGEMMIATPQELIYFVSKYFKLS